VTVAILPPQTTVNDLVQVNGMAVGLMSTGIGDVPPEQTYLDISQGNRVNDTLYDRDLPPLPAFVNWVPGWKQIVARANSAPADVYPGLLAGLLGVRDVADASLRDAALIVADRPGFVSHRVPGPCAQEPCRVFRVTPMSPSAVRALAGDLARPDLLIALVAPSAGRGLTPIGIAGQGFRGELTSDSTRTSGYVLSTNLLSTVLRGFGSGKDLSPYGIEKEPIRGEGNLNVAAINDLAARMEVIPDRRAPVVILALIAWILVTASVALRPELRRGGLAWLALAFAYMPLMLLAAAAIEPSAVGEGLLVGLGAAALAALTLALVRGWWALMVACAITVIAYAIDVMTGSELTKLSLLGPNPIFGVRFYGIGNELEALIAVMVPVGVGAGLTAAGEERHRRAVLAFLGVGAIAAVIFAAGRFGADVGAAVVLTVGAAVPAALTSGTRRNLVVAVVAAPLVALGALALIDLISGGDSHLTRSVLDAGGAGDLADIAQRRLELSAHDFAQAAGNPLFWAVILGIGLAIWKWRRIDAWLRPAQYARAGVIGACAAVAVGVLFNDSGATFLVLGSLALGAAFAFAWAQAQTDP
jgi:hypothetical protein